MKKSKCEFMKEEINYLGFIVGKNGIKADANKVKVIKEMRPPTDVRGVRSFMGCVSCYRRFCPNFSEIALPLTNLTKKHARFAWTAECQEAFEKLKCLLTRAPTLAYPDHNHEYTLYTDSSGSCIGAVLNSRYGSRRTACPLSVTQAVRHATEVAHSGKGGIHDYLCPPEIGPLLAWCQIHHQV